MGKSSINWWFCIAMFDIIWLLGASVIAHLMIIQACGITHLNIVLYIMMTNPRKSTIFTLSYNDNQPSLIIIILATCFVVNTRLTSTDHVFAGLFPILNQRFWMVWGNIDKSCWLVIIPFWLLHVVTPFCRSVFGCITMFCYELYMQFCISI